MKSIIHRAKHIGLQSVLCTISAFWTVADVYSADRRTDRQDRQTYC